MEPGPGTENKARICRVTCGWRLPGLDIAKVRRYWRDVHSPAISRRAGIHEYRHMQFAAVRSDAFPALDGVAFACPAATQLNWLSDVRYVDQHALDQFGADPGAEVKARMLSDIEMLVDQSTTYLVLGGNGHTFKDESGDPAPLGPCVLPTFGLFLRERAGTAAFRARLTEMVQAWAANPGVVRARLSLFEVPDMEAERKAGYPIKTHPPERQYQAWIDLTVRDEGVCSGLLPPDLGAAVAELHAYPVDHVYTFNYGGRPTLAGLRGFSAVEAMGFFEGRQHRSADLLEWMFGAVARGGPSL